MSEAGDFTRAAPPRAALLRIERDDLEPAPGGAFRARDALIERAARALWGGPDAARFAVCHGAVVALREAGLGFDDAVAATVALWRDMCRRTFELLLERHADALNPLGLELEPIEYPVDGYSVNANFMGEMDFSSTKQLHFDIVEPLGSNLYGPNSNVAGGAPAFADARAYCRANGLDITAIVDKVPGGRNLTLAPDHYARVLSDYTVVYRVDMETDTPFTLIVNRVREAGLLHGAESPAPADPERPVVRPLRHYAFDDTGGTAAERWYADLGDSGVRAPGDPAALKPLVPAGVRPPRDPLVIDVP